MYIVVNKIVRLSFQAGHRILSIVATNIFVFHLFPTPETSLLFICQANYNLVHFLSPCYIAFFTDQYVSLFQKISICERLKVHEAKSWPYQHRIHKNSYTKEYTYDYTHQLQSSSSKADQYIQEFTVR